MNLREKTEVTKEQYLLINKELPGICFHKEEKGRYYVKIAHAKYTEVVKGILSK